MRAARRLNRFVRHFEPLSYEPRTVHRGHVRVRRSLGSTQTKQQVDRHVYVRFQGFNRQGTKILFHGDPSSRVYGGLHSGVFEGSIQSRWGRFYVEGAHKFFARRTPFHSVMYAAEDASIPHEGWCGVNGETSRWMQQLATASEQARNAVSKPSTAKHHSNDHLERWIGRRALGEQDQNDDYYRDRDVDNDIDEKLTGAGDSARRHARANRGSKRTYRVCGLYVQIDHLLYRKFAEIDNDPVRTRERLSTLIAGHAARASDVYRHTDFKGIEDVKFSVHKIKAS
ncbi:hypothetical protein HPB50_008169 [Hyalomma asiaticum]|uniref:Uncharacterized protein n=1 Tax=Hyalomma asiaticum TaxID=266040 RepID=A0ACB7S5Q1_HYAAI|nr:hypothetical protein HPB50_008169 [Hyalomma asiaticum]